MKTMTSREFSQHTSKAQRAAEIEPIIITNRSKPAFVFLTYEQYKQLAGKNKTALDVVLSLNAPDVADIELEIAPRSKAQRPYVDLDMED